MIKRRFVTADGRLSLYWRLFGYFVAWFLLMKWTSPLRIAALEGPISPSLALVSLYALLFMAGVLAITWLFRRFVDRRPWSGLALPLPLRSLGNGAAGLGLSVLMASLVFLGLRAAGAVEVVGYEPATNGLATALLYTALFLISRVPEGFCEEILFRGYWLQNLAEVRPIWRPTLGIGLVFGLLHLGKVSSPLDNLILIATAVALTFFLVAARLLTGSLWLAIGWHAGWNWAASHIFRLRSAGGPDYAHAFIHLEPMPQTGALEYETLTLLLELAVALGGLGLMLLLARFTGRRLPWSGKLDPEGRPLESAAPHQVAFSMKVNV